MSDIIAIPINRENGIIYDITSALMPLMPAYPAHTMQLTCLDALYSGFDPDSLFVTYPTWQSTEVPPETFGDELFTLKTKNYNVIDFYVNSLPIAEITEENYANGSGTASDPWRNLIYAYSVLSCVQRSLCTGSYICLHVNGTVDYTFNTIDWEMYGASGLDTLPIYDILIMDFAGCTFSLNERITAKRYYDVMYPCHAVLNLTADVHIEMATDNRYGATYWLFGQSTELVGNSTLNIVSSHTADGYTTVELAPKLVFTSNITGSHDADSIVAVRGAVYNSGVSNVLTSAIYKHSELTDILLSFAGSDVGSIALYACELNVVGDPEKEVSVSDTHLYSCHIEAEYITVDGYMYNSDIITNSSVILRNTSNNNTINAAFDKDIWGVGVELYDNTHNNDIHCSIQYLNPEKAPVRIFTSASDVVQVHNTVTCIADLSGEGSRYSIYGNIVSIKGDVNLRDFTVSVPTFEVSGDYYGIQVCAMYAPSSYNVTMYNCNIWQGICKPGVGFDGSYDWCEDFSCMGI